MAAFRPETSFGRNRDPDRVGCSRVGGRCRAIRDVVEAEGATERHVEVRSSLTVGSQFVRRLSLIVIFLALAGCGSTAPSHTSIDEKRGTYRGVGIGDRPEQIFHVFGRKPISGTAEPVSPLKDDFVDIGGATVISSPCKGSLPGAGRVTTLRYDHVSFLLCDDHVYALIVAVDNARTRRGVAVGDDLAEARQSYAALSCGKAPYGEGLLGEQPSYPYCGGKLRAARWLWFGDPIRSITISTGRLRT